MEELLEFCEKMREIASDAADDGVNKNDKRKMEYNSGAEFAYSSVIGKIKEVMKSGRMAV